MVTGIVLVNVERAMIRTVIEDLMKIEGVSEVYFMPWRGNTIWLS